MDSSTATMSLNSLFNNITYSELTIKILKNLDPIDLIQVSLVNSFCHKTCRKTKNIIKKTAEDNMEKGAVVYNTLLKWKGKGQKRCFSTTLNNLTLQLCIGKQRSSLPPLGTRLRSLRQTNVHRKACSQRKRHCWVPLKKI
jgi:hypothetical protein